MSRISTIEKLQYLFSVNQTSYNRIVHDYSSSTVNPFLIQERATRSHFVARMNVMDSKRVRLEHQIKNVCNRHHLAFVVRTNGKSISGYRTVMDRSPGNQIKGMGLGGGGDGSSSVQLGDLSSCWLVRTIDTTR